MHKTILMPKHKMPLSILSPCVSVREYRGSARRARGLNTIVEQKYETPLPVVSRNITGYRLAIGGGRTSTLHRKVLSSSPVFCNAKYRGGVTEVTEGLKQYSSVFEWFLYSFLAVSRSITRYFSSHYRRYLNLLPCVLQRKI